MRLSGMRWLCEPLVAAGSAMVSDDATTTVRYSARSEMVRDTVSARPAGDAIERNMSLDNAGRMAERAH